MSETQQDALAAAGALHGVRIVRVSTVPFFVVTQLKRQIEHLVANAADVTVITARGPELRLLMQMPGVRCVPVPIPRAISPLRDLIALFLLWQQFSRLRPDIVHSTTPKAGLLTALAARLAGVPIRLHTFTGQPWVGMKGLRRGLVRMGDRLTALLDTHCYADSASQRQFLIEQGVVDAPDISVIGAGSLAGVDLQRFDAARFTEEQRTALRSALGIPAGAEVLLFVGRITADKGVRELLHAYARLKAAGSKAHLVFVGPVDSESGAGGAMQQWEIEAVRDTHLVGYTEEPERYLAIADLLCLPSHREGFGTVVIEAAAMGIPTVGTDIYGLSDAIVDGHTGLLVPVRDAEALHLGLAKLLADAALRRRMGEAALRRARELFAAEKVNAGMVGEYLDLLKREG